MDVSTEMENNTTEYKNEKLVPKNAAKRKLPFGNEQDLKEHAKNDTKRKIVILKRKQDRYKPATCTVCFKSMRSNNLKLPMKVHRKKEKLNDNVNSGKENAIVKRHILNHLSMIHGSYETIKKLVKML